MVSISSILDRNEQFSRAWDKDVHPLAHILEKIPQFPKTHFLKNGIHHTTESPYSQMVHNSVAVLPVAAKLQYVDQQLELFQKKWKNQVSEEFLKFSHP